MRGSPPDLRLRKALNRIDREAAGREVGTPEFAALAARQTDLLTGELLRRRAAARPGHRRSPSGRRPVHRRGSRRTTTRSSARGDPDDDGGDPEPLAIPSGPAPAEHRGKLGHVLVLVLALREGAGRC